MYRGTFLLAFKLAQKTSSTGKGVTRRQAKTEGSVKLGKAGFKLAVFGEENDEAAEEEVEDEEEEEEEEEKEEAPKRVSMLKKLREDARDLQRNLRQKVKS